MEGETSVPVFDDGSKLILMIKQNMVNESSLDGESITGLVLGGGLITMEKFKIRWHIGMD